MEDLEKNFYIFPKVEISLESLESQGWILDLGGGGEGVIGKLMGEDVVAIDFQEKELPEAIDGPLKLILTAMDLRSTSG